MKTMNNMKYIDLGLPSGTLWAESNEEGFYTFNEAVEKYSDGLPTREQFEELMDQCQWEWIGNGYKVTGPNGNCIVLPSDGYCFYIDGVYGVGSIGFYWSSSPKDLDDVWGLGFKSDRVSIDDCDYRCYGRSVRLVKKKDNNMKNKKLNLVEILKDCPEGTPLYSPIFGNVTFHRINHYNKIYPIIVFECSVHIRTRMFTEDGRYATESDGECMLFPSKENRDWSTFKMTKKEHVFKPFDKVLVRDYDGEDWHTDLFSHLHIDGQHKCIGGCYIQCIPYEGNEHLLGICYNPSSL